LRPLKNTGERAPKLKQIRAGLKDELVFQLSSKITIDWEKLVNSLWFGIKIDRSLRIELEQLQNIDPRGFDIVVTEAIQTLFDGINSRYYHTVGLPYKVTWRLEPLEGTMGSPGLNQNQNQDQQQQQPQQPVGSSDVQFVLDTIAKEASYDITSKK
jgi:hypothetical protein